MVHKRDLELELKTINGITVLTSPKLLRERSMLVCFTTRIGGKSLAPYNSLNLALHVGDDKVNVLDNRDAVANTLALQSERLTIAQQVHGDGVAIVTSAEVGMGAYDHDDAIADVDGLVTAIKGVPLAVFSADCVPIALCDKKGQVVGVVHAGWKGVYLGIVSRAIELFKVSFSVPAQDIIAFIGPCISREHYEVSERLKDDFEKRFGAVSVRPGSRLDLAAIMNSQLVEAGLNPEYIISSRYCTYERSDLFYSYRRDGKCGRQAVIVHIGE